MQLSRIKRMSEKRKEAWLEAIDKLEKDYINDRQDILGCPLCTVVVYTSCIDCLWNIIEGCGCMSYYWEDYVGIPEKWEKEYYKAWKIHRLKMLKRWRRIIKEN